MDDSSNNNSENFDRSLSDKLSTIGSLPDTDIIPAELALILSSASHPGRSSERYHHHLEKLAYELKKHYAELLNAGDDDDLGTRRAALKYILSDKQSYNGDEDPYHLLENADLINVIDQRRGLSVCLVLLYLYAGRAQEWDIHGLDIAGHFVVRLDFGGERMIFDPAEQCRILQAPELRQLVKKKMGGHAELSTEFYEPIGNRDIVIRLQNHIKLCQIEEENYKDALTTVENMRLFAPDEYRLLLDAGILYARTGKHEKAVDALEEYIDKAPLAKDRHDATLLLNEIIQSPQ